MVTVTETTWQALAHIAAAPREFLIALSRTSPDHVRALSSADAQKLFKTVTPSEIAQIAIRTYLQRLPASHSVPPATLGEQLARAVIHDFPDVYGAALQNEAATARKTRPFEKRTKRLLIKLTPAENDRFRAFANRAGLGPSDLGGLLIERFAHQFPEHLRHSGPRENKSEQNANKSE
jgi:hypothetical protein